MFTKLKQKIQAETRNVEEKTPKPAHPAPGLASPVSKDCSNSPFVNVTSHNNSDLNHGADVSRFSSIDNDLLNAEAELEEKTDDLSSSESRCHLLQVEITSQRDHITSLNVRCSDLEETNKALIKSLETSQVANNHAELDRINLVQKETLEISLTETREQLIEHRESSCHKIAVLEQKVKYLNSRLADYTHDMNKGLRESQSKEGNLEKEVDSWKSKLQMALLEVKDKEKIIDVQKQNHEVELSRRLSSASLVENELREQIRQLKSHIQTFEKAKERERQITQDIIVKLESKQTDWLEREIDMEGQITQLEESLLQTKVLLSEKDKEAVRLKYQLLQKQHQMESADQQRSEHELNRNKFQEDANKYQKAVTCLEKDLHSCVKEKDDLLLRNAQLSQEFETFKRQNVSELRDLQHDMNQRDSAMMGLEKSLQDIQEENTAYQAKMSTLEAQQDAALDRVESDEINRLKQTLNILEDQLADKSKTVKMLQQRLTDLKKTLQRELKVQALPNDEHPGAPVKTTNTSSLPVAVAQANGDSHSQSSPPSIPVTHSYHSTDKRTHKPANSVYMRPHLPNMHHHMPMENISSRRSSSSSHYCDPKDFSLEVNREYLKHVVLKFILSSEHEALHLIKAIAMLLHFSPDEQRLIKDTLDWKSSWFGTRPPVGRGQLAKVIPSTY